MTRRALLVLTFVACCHPRAPARTTVGAEPTRPAPEPKEKEKEAQPDPLACKTPEEKWAWAAAVVPDIGKLTPAPAAADFSRIGLQNGKVTLYAVNLALPMNETQPAPCTPLPMVLDQGELVTRVSIDGRKAKPDLKDNYSILRLGRIMSANEGQMDGLGHEVRSTMPDPLLSDSEKGVLRYDGRPAGYAVTCAMRQFAHVCHGQKQMCHVCEPLIIEVPDAGAAAFGLGSDTQTCDPCPPDPVGDKIDAVNRVVTERSFMSVEPGSGPSFYLAASDCKRDARSKAPK